MLGRAWDFAKRHRRKLIASGVLVGGGLLVWKVVIPKLQERLLRKLLREAGGLDSLLEEFATAPGDPKEERQAGFRHRQQVSDSFARRNLETLQLRHNECFSIAECYAKLEEAKKAGDSSSKAACFKELQVECMARLSSALYTLHLVLLLHRVEFNIVGRELAQSVKQPSQDGSNSSEVELTTFLESAEHFQERAIKQITNAVRKAAIAVVERSSLVPTSRVTAADLEKFFLDVFKEADAELLEGEKGAAVMLPEELDQQVPELHRKKVKAMLDEARDALDSPQLLQVLRAVLPKAATQIAAAAIGDGAQGAPVLLAKMFGDLIKLSAQLLDPEGAADFISRFGEEPMVNQLCEGLYFQGS